MIKGTNDQNTGIVRAIMIKIQIDTDGKRRAKCPPIANHLGLTTPHR